MKNIVALRVVQSRKWNENDEYYEPVAWSLEYQVEGSTDWNDIPVLNKYSGGSHDGLSQVSSEVKAEKE